MDFEKFVKPVTDYLNFFLAYWGGDYQILFSSPVNEGIQPSALLLTFVSIGFFLIIRYTRLNIIHPDPEPLSGHGPKLDTTSLLLLMITSLVTPLLFEISLYLLKARESVDFGNSYVSYNAGLYSVAALYPISAVISRTNSFANTMQKLGGLPAKLALAINTIVGLLGLWISVLSFRPFLLLHDVTFKDVIWPVLLSFLIIFLITMGLGYFLFQWNKYLKKQA